MYSYRKADIDVMGHFIVHVFFSLLINSVKELNETKVSRSVLN